MAIRKRTEGKDPSAPSPAQQKEQVEQSPPLHRPNEPQPIDLNSPKFVIWFYTAPLLLIFGWLWSLGFF